MRKYDLSGYFYQAHLYPNGHYILSYTLGLALLEFPFFCLGHLFAMILGYPTDGFSIPYQFSITVCGTFYSLVGLWFTYRNLEFFFTQSLSLLLLCVIVFATNYFYYSAFENGMTHTYLFTAYAATIYYTVKWHRHPKLNYAIGLGIAIGLAIVMRPSEIVIILIPLLWSITDKVSLRDKYIIISNAISHLIVLSIMVLAIGFLQLIYWKYASGHWLYNSYKETGQSFDFLHPELLKGIFSLKKGWLVYSPVMILLFFGLFAMYKKANHIFWSISIYFVINIWIVFSWCQWDYGGGFASRPLVQSYAVLVLALGFAVESMFSKPLLKYLTILFLVSCIGLNLMQTIQYAKGMLSPGGLNKYSYCLLFGKLAICIDDLKAFQGLDKFKGSILFVDTLSVRTSDSPFILTKPIHLPKTETIIYSGDLKLKPNGYIQISAHGKFDYICYNYSQSPSLILSFLDLNENLLAQKTIKIEPLINKNDYKLNVDYLGDPNIWCPFNFSLKLPESAKYLTISCVNQSTNNTQLDSLLIQQVNLK
jgi:hypothetical protein